MKARFNSSIPTLNLVVYLWGCAALLLFATDVGAWGVPGAAEPGTGSGPGGGSHSGGVPAPFGVLFLSFGVLLSVWFKKDIVRRVHRQRSSFRWFAVACWAGWKALTPFYSPSRHRIVSENKQPKTVGCPCVFLTLFALVLGFILPISFAPMVGLAVLALLLQFDTSRQQQLLFGLVVILVGLASQPFWLPVNEALQAMTAKTAAWGLHLLGAPAWANGTTINGLSTTIHVTQACVGLNVIASTSALAWFLTYSFAPQRKQLGLWLCMMALALALNWLRIVAVSWVGHYFPEFNFVTLHDATGLLIAFMTYVGMGVVLWWGAHSRSLLRAHDG